MIRRSGNRPPFIFPSVGMYFQGEFVDENVLSVNLSYVLHEPSTSKSVKRAARAIKRFERHQPGLRDRILKLSDSDLLGRVICVPGSNDSAGSLTSDVPIISAHVGLPELLPRIIRLLTGVDFLPEIHLIDDPIHAQKPVELQLFGAPARFDLPLDKGGDIPVAIAGLVVRPGNETLMFSCSLVPFSDALRSVEALIRDHHNQWMPQRSLWAAPAEVTIPEVLIDTRLRGEVQ